VNRFWWLNVPLILAVGCGAEQYATSSARYDTKGEAQGEAIQPAADAPNAAGNAALALAPAERKIIYTASLNLVVKDFAAAETQVPQLVKQFEGYIASASVDRSQGSWLSGRWTVRIPVANYNPFLDEATKLGIAERREQTAEDVTEEYVDLEARIANKKKLEERVLALLEAKTGEIKDVIEVERELARVREEVERMQGRIEFLRNRTAFTTITLNVREERDYVPPQAPTFTGRIASVWSGSLEALRKAGEAFVLVVVALFPWAVLAAVIILPFSLLVRRRFRQHRAATTP
jgi:hypothetical protein